MKKILVVMFVMTICGNAVAEDSVRKIPDGESDSFKIPPGSTIVVEYPIQPVVTTSGNQSSPATSTTITNTVVEHKTETVVKRELSVKRLDRFTLGPTVWVTRFGVGAGLGMSWEITRSHEWTVLLDGSVGKGPEGIGGNLGGFALFKPVVGWGIRLGAIYNREGAVGNTRGIHAQTIASVFGIQYMTRHISMAVTGGPGWFSYVNVRKNPAFVADTLGYIAIYSLSVGF